MRKRGARVQLADVVRTLPRRAHDIPRRAVEASQKWRLLEAMTEVVAKKGYLDASVADVIGAANVSRKTFYEQFRDKEDCFLSAYDVLSDRLVAALVTIGEDLPDGPARRAAQLEAFLAALARDLLVARVFMVDVLGAGPRALLRRERVNRSFGEALLSEALEPVRRAAIVGGINAVVAGALLGRGVELAALAGPLCAFIESAL